jgi:hypothetical protein
MFVKSTRTLVLKIFICAFLSASLHGKTVKKVNIFQKNIDKQNQNEEINFLLQIKDFLGSFGMRKENEAIDKSRFNNFNDIIQFAKNLEEKGRLNVNEFFMRNSNLLKEFLKKQTQVSFDHFPFIQKCKNKFNFFLILSKILRKIPRKPPQIPWQFRAKSKINPANAKKLLLRRQRH